MELLKLLAVPAGALGSLITESWRALQGETGYRDVPPVQPSPLVVGSAVLDRSFTLALNLLSGVPGAHSVRQAHDELERVAEFVVREGWLDDPAAYHGQPGAPESWDLVARRSLIGRAPYHHLRFPSGFRPPGEHPARDRWMDHDANHTAHAWILEHSGAPRPWLVCVHGFSLGAARVNLYAFEALWLHRELGLNVALPVLPLHGPRATGSLSGGELLSFDYMNMLLTFAQGTWDVRRLLGWIRERGGTRIGLTGQSMGAYVSALTCGLESDLECVIAGIPVADLPRAVRENMPRLIREYEQEFQLDWELLRRATHVVSPLAFEPRLPRERRFIYAGTADRVARPAQARALWRHWGEPEIHWFSGSHIGARWVPSVATFVERALRRSELIADPT